MPLSIKEGLSSTISMVSPLPMPNPIILHPEVPNLSPTQATFTNKFSSLPFIPHSASYFSPFSRPATFHIFSHHPKCCHPNLEIEPPISPQGSLFSWTSVEANSAIPRARKTNKYSCTGMHNHEGNKAVNIFRSLCKSSCFRVHASF